MDKCFKPGEVVVDAMAGIGPFAVPAAKRGCRVFANDLNPDSFKWLEENVKINRVADAVSPYMLDGREFMRLAAGGKLEVRWAPGAPPPKAPRKKKGGADSDAAPPAPPAPAPVAAAEAVATDGAPVFAPAFHHIVMNLPATAVEFLDALPGAFDPEMWAQKELPMVHVYAFLKGDQSTQGEIFVK